mmetsp:Transcript_111848/g.312700  ORF Transcript_111848/g.312700 Transcript_111848/m.312700 type:complete len:319 (+) Transcript_111848:572-1528(+)
MERHRRARGSFSIARRSTRRRRSSRRSSRRGSSSRSAQRGRCSRRRSAGSRRCSIRRSTRRRWSTRRRRRSNRRSTRWRCRSSCRISRMGRKRRSSKTRSGRARWSGSRPPTPPWKRRAPPLAERKAPALASPHAPARATQRPPRQALRRRGSTGGPPRTLQRTLGGGQRRTSSAWRSTSPAARDGLRRRPMAIRPCSGPRLARAGTAPRPMAMPSANGRPPARQRLGRARASAARFCCGPLEDQAKRVATLGRGARRRTSGPGFRAIGASGTTAAFPRGSSRCGRRRRGGRSATWRRSSGSCRTVSSGSVAATSRGR